MRKTPVKLSRITAAAVACLTVTIAPAYAQRKTVIGWVEKVSLQPGDAMINAKIDTGADYSSIDASDISQFEKNGQPWIRFNVTDRFGKQITIEKELKRTARVKRGVQGTEKRPVVRLGICIGKTFMQTDVNIVDRRHFDYQMLIGRSFLAGNFTVDPAQTYTVDPECKGVRP